jgi:hypothetical protein
MLDGLEEFTFAAGEILTVDLAQPGIPVDTYSLVLEARSPASGAMNDHGILVQAPDGNGGWRSLCRLYPRAVFDELVVDSNSFGMVRLVFEQSGSVRFVGRLVTAAPGQAQWADLVSSRSGHSGDTRGTLAAADSANLTLFGSDTLSLAFAVLPQAEGTVRDYFLQVEATRLATKPELSAIGATALVLPIRFALHQNQPNPFGSRTTIRFDLPVGAIVRLELFDVRGRHVGVLTDRYFPPGSHSVDWDIGPGARSPIGPGIYFYRIQAGPMRDRKKLVVLP